MCVALQTNRTNKNDLGRRCFTKRQVLNWIASLTEAAGQTITSVGVTKYEKKETHRKYQVKRQAGTRAESVCVCVCSMCRLSVAHKLYWIIDDRMSVMNLQPSVLHAKIL